MSYDTVMTDIKNAVDVLETLRTDGQTSMITKIDTFTDGMTSPRATTAGEALKSIRLSYADLLAAGKAVLDPLLLDLAQEIGSSYGPDDAQFWVDLRQYQQDNTKHVKTRAFSFGTASADAGNTGDGTIYKLTVDKHAEPIEATWPCLVTTATVESDQNTGTDVGREVFRITQGAANQDRITEDGNGVDGELVGHAGDELLSNSSFQSFSGTAGSPTDITDWESDLTVNGTNFDFDSSNYYRTSPEERDNGTSYGLTMKASGYVQQKLFTRRISVGRDVPYLALVRWNRQVNSAAGTLTLTVGSNSVNVAASAQTGWQTLVLALDKNLWYDNFASDDAYLRVNWSQTGGTGIIIDDVCFGPMDRYDNLWYFAVGGSTHWLVPDKFTFTDTVTDSKIQGWFWRIYNEYVKSDATPSTPDP